jgi:hypothetical protein
LFASVWWAQPVVGNAAKEVISAALDGCMLEVDRVTDEASACWRLQCEATTLSASERNLGCDLTAMHQVVELLPAPSRNSELPHALAKRDDLLAVLSVGEGHPVLEIVLLRALLEQGTYRARCTFNPFPGSIQVKQWEGGFLLVEADIDLSATNKGSMTSEPGSVRTFWIDGQSCAVSVESR